MLRRVLASLAAVTMLVAATSVQAEKSESRIGQKIENFELRDYRGKMRSLSEFDSSEYLVVAFVGVECPLAKLYAPRLQELHEEFASKGVSFIGIDSNRQDSLTELAAYARIHNIEFPVVKDTSNEVADKFQAVRTPEVFVLDKDRVVRYWGRIDDQYGLGASSGYAKPEIQRRHLAVALEELMAGKEVSEPVVEAPGCFIGRVSKVDPHGEITYSNKIAHILQKRCTECHRKGDIAPFQLTDYDEVVGWAETMLEVIDEGRMPPWFANPEHGTFANDARMSDEEKHAIKEWVANGMPQGDPSELPEPRQYVEGWRIPQPDQVVHIADEPYTVQAEGVVEYQYFTVDPGWEEDKWIVAAESRPDNRAVVHHIIVFFQPPRDRSKKGRGNGRRRGGSISGYAPGEGARIHRPGVATMVPAGSKLIFQMHYTPNGSVQKDRSSVGFVFADPKTITRRAQGGAAINQSFSIPPNTHNHEVTSKFKFQKDSLVTGFLPHMHLRGKSFRFEANYPSGSKEILLDVPNYDFNWQLRYRLETPKLMPAGTVIECTAHFDNSEDNLANPDPNETVTWGDQTWEEMMIGFINFEDPHEDLQAQADASGSE